MLSKARTLESLRGTLDSAEVLAQHCFTVGQWRENASQQFKALKAQEWAGQPLIVRSSGKNEDSATASLAGHFESVLNVRGEHQLRTAIEQVIASFGEAGEAENEIFIQPMLGDVAVAGVAFTRDPNTAAPYIKINYDDESGTTDSITAGHSNQGEVFYFHKHHEAKFGDFRDAVIALCRELETKLKCDALDIEFAVDKNGTLYLFQVRPLIIDTARALTDDEHYECLKNLRETLSSWIGEHPYLYGKKGIYGVMPDWNPAEIVGIKPKPLSLSIYREVITNSIWAYQRDNYGYCNLRSFPLLVEFEGMPYVDIRVSFNSFIPKVLDKKIAEKLVNYYLDRLRDNPELHDKVEFEIIYSCYSFDTPERMKILESHGFDAEEIKQIADSLITTTNDIISHENGLWKKDLSKIAELEERYDIVTQSDLSEFSKIYWLIEDCKRYGTLPFAGLARTGFIAVELLSSLVKVGILSKNEYEHFFSSLNTVSSTISSDFAAMDKERFAEKYGHLRPGTYDILSKSYDEDLDGYFNWESAGAHANANREEFRLSVSQLNAINQHLREYGFKVDALELLNFIKEAIEAREYSKFVFTRSISKVLKIYGEVAGSLNIPLEDAAYTHINSILSLNSTATDPEKILRASIARRKQRFEVTKALQLPPLICDTEDLFYFHDRKCAPNYITQKSISGEICALEGSNKKDIAGKIVLIENADPGFDWIFSHNIIGLVTKYGGANSHMAIRSGELGIPAVIGAGSLYDHVRKHPHVTLDCLNKKTLVKAAS